jgi:class 3 adenylate cyclase/predicted ATPase
MTGDIERWLAELGLEDYAPLFRQSEIDLHILPELDEADFEKLGIPIGHRRKLLRAIRALGEAQHAPAAAAPHLPSSGAERRHLTVMMCDLVGSTELSARLDPEDLREVIHAYQEVATAEIARYDGHLAMFVGDGVLAWFGYPKAHEDDAERAVRAGLGILEALRQLRPRPDVSLQARVGVATGVVIVGDLIGKGASQQEMVTGEPPNLVARLQTLAAPNSVVIAPTTRRLLGELFEVADLGLHQLKGFPEPVRVWQVVRENVNEGRFEALRGRHLSPLVGREHELDVLVQAWGQARQGSGQAVLLAGEPGIGKSRLVRALQERVAGDPHRRLNHYCSPYHVNSALHPVIVLFERMAKIAADDPPAVRLDKLEAAVEHATRGIDDAVPLLASLLSIPTAERYPPLNLSPQRQMQRTLEVLVLMLETSAREQPVLAVFEDVHWIDPSTLELLGMLIERAPRLPLLVVVTFRPDFDPPWPGQIPLLTVKRLDSQQGAAMAERLAGGKALPPELLDQIVDRTGGVPLFVEELTKTVLESTLLVDAGDHWELRGPLTSVAIPSTLHDSLMERLDRLSAVKEIAQIGAVIGRSFSRQLLAAVANLPEARLQEGIEQLAASELVFRSGMPPTETYTFKHALVHDAAYQSLLRAKRRRLHGQVGAAIEHHFPTLVESEPEIVARHYTEAGILPTAIDYWRQAAEHAIQRSANTEAIGHLSKGLELVKSLPASPERAEQELALHARLGAALAAARGFSAPEVEAAYSRARQVARELGDPSKGFSAVRGLWVYSFIRADLRGAHELARQLLDLAEREARPDYLVEAHRTLGQTLLYLGEFAASHAHSEQGLALYDPAAHRTHIYLYGNDPGIVCSSYLAYALWFLGRPDEALRHGDEALSRARRLGHPFTLAFALAFAAYLRQHLQDVPATRQLAEEAVAISTEQGFPFWGHQETILRGWALARQGEIEDGLAQIHKGLDAYRALGSGLARPWFLALLAEVDARAGRVEEGLAALDEAMATVERSGERFYLAELHRLQGELIFARRGPEGTDEALACYRQALDISRAQGALALELRSAASLAELWGELGRADAALELLAPLVARFPTRLLTADLARAEELLARLRQN